MTAERSDVQRREKQQRSGLVLGSTRREEQNKRQASRGN